MNDVNGYFLLANGADPADVILTDEDRAIAMRGWRALEKPGGVWGLTVCGRNDVIDIDEASVAWSEYRTRRAKNAGYVGPEFFGGSVRAYFRGIEQLTMYDAGAGWIIRAWHRDERVEPAWIDDDRFTCEFLEDLLREIDAAAADGDPDRSEAQNVCAAVKADLEFPDEFWEAVRAAPPGRRFGRRGIELVYGRFDRPKRNRPMM